MESIKNRLVLLWTIFRPHLQAYSSYEFVILTFVSLQSLKMTREEKRIHFWQVSLLKVLRRCRKIGVAKKSQYNSALR